MRLTVTPAEMKRVETRVMNETAVTGDMLMQRAAAHVAAAVRGRAKAGLVWCVCATGNNAGDGLAAMRMLAVADDAFAGEVWLMEGALSPDARRELERLEACAGAARVRIRRLEGGALPQPPKNVGCIIDALFGTGLSRPLAGVPLALCRLVNAAEGVPVVAVDIPSGLNGDTGEVMGEAVRADETVTFHRPKPGLYLREGPDYAGRIIVADIGIPSALDDAQGLRLLEERDLAGLLPARRRVSHKGSYGRVLLWAGSPGMAGAAAICATAALRTGAGLVTVACPEAVMPVVQMLCPCATCLPLPMTDADAAWTLLKGALERADALGVGCGLGQGEAAAELFERLLGWLGAHELPVVLDADALNLLARRPARLNGGTRVLTPHPAEAARLLGTTVQEVLADAPHAASQLWRRYGAAVALKGAVSMLCGAQGLALNPFGTPAMAKGGSGDALTGVTAALLAGRAAGAYRMDDLTLLQAACALHGLAGERAERQFGERGVLATDLCAFLGLAAESGRDLEGEAAVPPEEQPQKQPAPLGRMVTVTVECKLGTRDESGRVYALNYGHVQEALLEQNEWQDACVYGVNRPVEWFEGEVVACLRMPEGALWAVAPKGTRPTPQEVRRAVAFLGQPLEIELLEKP